jgi:hypothetical protein
MFIFATASTPYLKSTQLPILCVSGTPSSGVKRPGRETGHSHSSSAEVKAAWSYTPTPPAWCLVNYRDNFTFIIYIASNGRMIVPEELILHSIFLEELRKATTTSFRIAELWAEILTRNLHNTKQVC